MDDHGAWDTCNGSYGDSEASYQYSGGGRLDLVHTSNGTLGFASLT
jgi:hypothetical protein